MKKDRIYVLFTRFARVMNVDSNSVYNWYKNGHLEAIWVGNQKMLLRKDAVKMLSDWRRSCTPTEAARLIGLNQSTIYGYISQGAVDAIQMFGYSRVLLSSIPRGKKYFSETAERLHANSVKLGQSNGHRWTSEEIKMMWEKKRVKKRIETGRLLTREDAARLLGVTVRELDKLPIRKKWLEGQEFLYAHSVEIFKSHGMEAYKKGYVKKKKVS